MRLLGTFILLSLLSFNSQALIALEFDRYHSIQDARDYMEAAAQENSDIATFLSMGESKEGRQLGYLKITKSKLPNTPVIYINGATHGNEKITSEGVLALQNYLITNQSDGNVSAILENYVLVLQPIVNPDSFKSGLRQNAQGIDINRDFSFPRRSTEKSFKSEEARKIKEFVDAHTIRAAITYHSGMLGVLWPWCHTKVPPEDAPLFEKLTRKTAHSMGMTTYKQSYQDYPTGGELIDYLYMSQKALAVTLEISQNNTPPTTSIRGISRRSILGAMTFMINVLDHDLGIMSENHAGAEIATGATDSLADGFEISAN